MTMPLLSLLIWMPLLGVVAVFFWKAQAKTIAISVSGLTFLLSVMVWLLFDLKLPGYQFVERHTWYQTLGLTYHLGVDGLSLLLVLLTTFLIPLCLLTSWDSIQKQVPLYMALFLLLETFLLGTFLSLNLMLFYAFFEAVLIPMYFLIGIWGGERRIYAALKFFLYTFFGSLVMLVAVLYLFYLTGSFEIQLLSSLHFAGPVQSWLWWAFFLAFAIKMPMWPLHTWLPDAHVEAPTGASVILAGVLLKIGGYGFLRFSIPFFPEASQAFAPWVFGLSIVGVVYTSLVALVQKDIKKLIAYSSIAHMGFVTMGIFTGTLYGISGGIVQMISHGLISGALFLCVGVLYDRMHTRSLEAYGGLVKKMPVFAIVFMIFIFATMGVPGTTGFIGEMLVLLGGFQVSGWIAFGVGLGLILGAAYSLGLYRGVMFGKMASKALEHLQDLSLREKLIFAPLVVLVVGLGIFPKPLLALVDQYEMIPALKRGSL